MKKIWFSVVFGGIMLMCGQAQAVDWQQDVNELRKDIRELHQKLRSIDENPVNTENSDNTQMRDKIDEYGSTLRKINERMDELEQKIAQYNDNLDKFNQKTDVRLKVLEARKNGTETGAEELTPNAPAATNGVVNANKPEDMYANAMQAYNNALYDEAELGFKDIIEQFPTHKLASNAQYWLGEVYSKQGNVNKAIQAFTTGYKKYKNGNKGAESLYRLGTTLASQKNNEGACVVFMSFAAEFPLANADLSKKVKAEAQKLGCK